MATDYKGMKFNKLLMITPIHGNGAGKGVTWLCQCDCGNVVERIGKDVARGRPKTCGNCAERLGNTGVPGPRVAKQNATERRMYAAAIRRATRDGISWDLTPSQYKEIVSKSCFACHTRPDTNQKLVLISPGQVYTLPLTESVCTRCLRRMDGDSCLEYLEYIQLLANTKIVVDK